MKNISYKKYSSIAQLVEQMAVLAASIGNNSRKLDEFRERLLDNPEPSSKYT